MTTSIADIYRIHPPPNTLTTGAFFPGTPTRTIHNPHTLVPQPLVSSDLYDGAVRCKAATQDYQPPKWSYRPGYRHHGVLPRPFHGQVSLLTERPAGHAPEPGTGTPDADPRHRR